MTVETRTAELRSVRRQKRSFVLMRGSLTRSRLALERAYRDLHEMRDVRLAPDLLFRPVVGC